MSQNEVNGQRTDIIKRVSRNVTDLNPKKADGQQRGVGDHGSESMSCIEQRCKYDGAKAHDMSMTLEVR